MYYIRNLNVGTITAFGTKIDVYNFFDGRKSLAFLERKLGRIFYIDDVPYTFNTSVVDIQNPPTISNRSKHLRYNIYNVENIDDEDSHRFLCSVADKSEVRKLTRTDRSHLDWYGLEQGKMSFVVKCGKYSEYKYLRIDMTMFNCNYPVTLDRPDQLRHVFLPGRFFVTDIISGCTKRYSSVLQFSTQEAIDCSEIYRAFHHKQLLRRNKKLFYFSRTKEVIAPTVSRHVMLYQYKQVSDMVTEPQLWSEPMSVKELAEQLTLRPRRVGDRVKAIFTSNGLVVLPTLMGQIHIRPYQTDTTIPYAISERGDNKLHQQENECCQLISA